MVLVDGVVDDVVDTPAVAVEGTGRVGPASQRMVIHGIIGGFNIGGDLTHSLTHSLSLSLSIQL